jgi:hypothetical protein
MDVANVSALSALVGSVVGGLTSGITTWLNQRAQTRAGLIIRELARREDLFRDFVVAASKTYGNAMVSRMRVLCLPRTIECADKVMLATKDTYFAPNRTIRELNDMIKSGAGIDPLKEFSEAAREELRTFTSE